MKVSVVLPNYNGVSLLNKNLNKIIEHVGNSEIIIVDDGSTDGSVDFLFKNFPNIKIIQKQKNTGFSSTVNLGFKAAANEIVLLLNTDTLINNFSLNEVLGYFKDNKLFAVGFMDDSIEDGKVITRGRGVGKFNKGFLMHNRGEVNKTSTLWVSGGSGAFSKIIWEKLGGLDELYDPFYWEDIDISYRALKSGYKIYFDPNIQIEHRHFEGSIKSSYTPKNIQKISYRNQFIFTWKNITDFNFLILHFLWLPAHLLQSLLEDRLLFKGFLASLSKLGEIRYKRIWVKKLFIRTDKEILYAFENE